MTVQVHVKADYHIFERGTLLRLSPRTARDRRLMYPFGPVMVRRGWTQTEAAHALGVNQRQITRWLGGVSPSVSPTRSRAACSTCTPRRSGRAGTGRTS